MDATIQKIDYRGHIEPIRVLRYTPKAQFDANPKSFTGPDGYTQPIQHFSVLQDLGSLLLVEVKFPSGGVQHAYRFLLQGANKDMIAGYWAYLVYHKAQDARVANPGYLIS